MEPNILLTIAQLAALTRRQITDYLKLNGYWLLVLLGYLRLNLFTVFKLCTTDFNRIINAYQSQPMLRARFEANIMRREQSVRNLTGDAFLPKPKTKMDVETPTATNFTPLPKVTDQDNQNYEMPEDSDEKFWSRLNNKVRKELGDFVTVVLRTEVRKPTPQPNEVDNGYEYTSPVFGFKLNVPLTLTVVLLLILGETGLMEQILTQILYLQGQIFGLSKSWFMAIAAPAIVLLSEVAMFRFVKRFLCEVDNKKTVIRTNLLVIAAVVLLVVNGILYFENVERSMSISNATTQIIANGDYSSNSLDGVTQNNDRFYGLRFISLCACSALSVLISAYLTVCLLIYTSLNRNLKRIEKLKRLHDQTYVTEEALYTALQSNREMVYQIFLNVFKIFSLQQLYCMKQNKTDKKHFWFYSLAIIATIALASCTEKQQQPKAKESNKIIVVAIDRSGSIDTVTQSTFRYGTEKYLDENIIDSSKAVVICSNIGSEVSYNDRRQFCYNPKIVTQPSGLMNDNDRVLFKLRTQKIQHQGKIAFTRGVADQIFSEKGRSGNTAILEYLYLLSQIESQVKDSISLLLISDMKQDSRISVINDFSTKDDAVRKAQQDLKMITKKYGLNNTSLATTKSITVQLPATTNNRQYISPLIEVYWRTVFSGLGAPSFNIYND